MIVKHWIFLEWEMFHSKFVKKIKTHILCSVMFFQKLCCLWDNVEKVSIARQATGDSMIQYMCFACWMTKATDTFRIYNALLLHSNSFYSSLPECYIISTLPFLLLNEQGSCLPFAHCFFFCARWVFFAFVGWSLLISIQEFGTCQ
jgi:hypothetical protein